MQFFPRGSGLHPDYLTPLGGAVHGRRRPLAGSGTSPVCQTFSLGTTHLIKMAEEVSMTEFARPRLIGLNHLALEVGDINEALAFYNRLFKFELRGKSDSMAFIDLGDQFIALQKGRKQPPDDGRHFGLVVDDKEAARRALEAAGVPVLNGPFLDFRDPWGNRVEIVGYDNIQFSKAPNVLRGMGLTRLVKNEKAKKELTDKGMAPD
jgi:predicted enzyme related to lactoylglutathione lyase